MIPQAKRYSIVARYYAEDDGYIATADEFPGLSAFGETREEAVREFQTVLDLAIQEYIESGWPLPSPEIIQSPVPDLPSGEFRVRLPRTIHAELSRQARLEGVSQNTLVIALLARGLEASALHQVEVEASL